MQYTFNDIKVIVPKLEMYVFLLEVCKVELRCINKLAKDLM